MQTSSTLLSLSFHYTLNFIPKKEITYNFLLNSQGSIAIILEVSQSPEAFQSFFTCRYNWSSSSLHQQSLCRLSQSTGRCTCHVHVPASHPAFIWQGNAAAHSRWIWRMWKAGSSLLQRKHLSSLFKRTAVRMTSKWGNYHSVTAAVLPLKPLNPTPLIFNLF